MKKYIALLFAVILMSCQTTQQNTAQVEPVPEEPVAAENPAPAESPAETVLTAEDLPFPCLTNTNGSPFELISFIDGTVKDIGTDELGLKKIVMAVSSEYFWKGETRTVDYNFVFGGMNDVSVDLNGQVSIGDSLGTASERSYITTYRTEADDFLVRMTGSKPVYYNEQMYFSPDWVIQGHTFWLSFRQVDDFKAAVSDFYSRWAAEGNEANGSTIHYYPDLDRIRARIQLSEYPVEAQRDSAVDLVEKTYYNGQKVYVLESLMKDLDIEGHSVVVYWQRDFDKYLQDEYTLNDDLYIYGSIFAIDHDENQILVFVRDFATSADEDIVDYRYSSMLNP